MSPVPVRTAAPDAQHTQRVQLEVSGMSCAACANRVESTLNKLPGVRASVNFATRVATIDAGDGTPTAALCEAVHQAGYDAEPRRAGGNSDVDPDADPVAQFKRFFGLNKKDKKDGK